MKTPTGQNDPVATIPAHHGWFSVWKNDDDKSRWATPLIAWRITNLRAGEAKDYVCGEGIMVPYREGDDGCVDHKQFVGYRWMPELYATACVVDDDSTSVHWDLPY